MTGQYSQYDLESMAVPTLVIHVADDPLAAFEDIERLVERIPNAEFQRYGTGGHLVFGHGDEIRQSATDFLAPDQIPELTTVPYEIGYHLVAELLTALTLIAAGIGRLRQHRWLKHLYPIALGEFAMVGMLFFLTLATLLLIEEYTVDRHRTRSLRAAE